MSVNDLGAYRRRVVVVTETPESKQPYSMMHRALYANIVGQDTFFGFPHGCTIKQLDGEDYIVDHVTRLAQPVRKIPALNPDSRLAAKTAAELINGIIKCESVLRNLDTRAKMAQSQLATSSQNAARHESILQNIQSRALTLQPPAPIADVITQRSNELVTVRALLSLIAQAMRAASTVAVRDLKPHQLTELHKVAPALHAKYLAWKSGELKLLEREEEEALKYAKESKSGEPTLTAENSESANPQEVNNADLNTETSAGLLEEEQEDGYDREDGLPADEDDASDVSEGPPPPDMAQGADRAEDPDMDDDIPMPSRNTTTNTQEKEQVADSAQQSDHTSDAVPNAPEPIAHAAASEDLYEDTTPSTVGENQQNIPIDERKELEEVVAPSRPEQNEVQTSIHDINDDNAQKEQPTQDTTSVPAEVPTELQADGPTQASPSTRQPYLSLPECSQPNVVILCIPCKTFIAFESNSLAHHDDSDSHKEIVGYTRLAPSTFTSELSQPPVALPSFVTSRPVPKRHVRVTDDNTFLDYYSVVRTGCSSCQKDVAVSDIESHATTEEHLDFLEDS